MKFYYKVQSMETGAVQLGDIDIAEKDSYGLGDAELIFLRMVDSWNARSCMHKYWRISDQTIKVEDAVVYSEAHSDEQRKFVLVFHKQHGRWPTKSEVDNLDADRG